MDGEDGRRGVNGEDGRTPEERVRGSPKAGETAGAASRGSHFERT